MNRHTNRSTDQTNPGHGVRVRKPLFSIDSGSGKVEVVPELQSMVESLEEFHFAFNLVLINSPYLVDFCILCDRVASV